jgi:hypothetical protein
MIRLEVLVREGTKFVLQSIYLNPTFVISFREHDLLTRDLRCEQMNRKFPEGLNREHTLSEVIYSEANTSKKIIAIGTPDSIQEKMLGNNKRTLLRG